MRNILIFLTVLLSSCSAIASDRWQIKSIKENYEPNAVEYPFPESTEIEFRNGRVVKTNVIEFEFIDFIQSTTGDQFIIYSGRSCSQCDINTSVYLNLVADPEYGLSRYTLPGELYYYEDNSLLATSRMFYGECLKKEETTVIWYQKYLGDDNKWHQAVYDIDFQGAKVVQNSAEIPYGQLEKTEALVAEGFCREVPGEKMTSEP